jgi:hypothetical protein
MFRYARGTSVDIEFDVHTNKNKELDFLNPGVDEKES